MQERKLRSIATAAPLEINLILQTKTRKNAQKINFQPLMNEPLM